MAQNNANKNTDIPWHSHFLKTTIKYFYNNKANETIIYVQKVFKVLYFNHFRYSLHQSEILFFTR